MKPLSIERLLQSQGFGNRKACRSLVNAGVVQIGGQVCEDPDAVVDPQGLTFSVYDKAWLFREKAYLMLHKPPGFECSQKPKHHPSVYTLFPVPLRQREVQCVGRLDEDTTGLLLLTDDGSFIHELTSPKKNIAKTYVVHCKHAVDDGQLQALREGVLLHDEQVQVAALAAERTDERHVLRLTIAEGKYHQVKRMVAAAGNRVEGLHRERVGDLLLPADLPQGQWRWLSTEDLSAARSPSLIIPL